MGYPRKYVGRYPSLASWLVSIGHIVYPYEMICEPVKKQITYFRSHYLYGKVDVVSRFQGKLWAWEYKSKSDNVLRGLKQVKNYARSFNYVCLVAENSGVCDRVVKAQKESVENILKKMGVGLVWDDEGTFRILTDPKLQNPVQNLNEALLKRFQRFRESTPRYHPERRIKLTKCDLI